MTGLSLIDKMFYSTYTSKYNKETILTLKETFTLPEFLQHREYLTICEDLEEESYTQARDKRK